MTMPIIPALAGTAAAPVGALTELLDSLTQEELTQLVADADAWVAAGEPMPGAEGEGEEDDDADEAGEGEVETEYDAEVEEHVEDLEAEAAETPEEQAAEAEAGVEDFQALLAQVQAAEDSAAGYLEELTTMQDAAEASSDVGGDPDAIGKLIEEAEGLSKEIADLVQDAADAADDEDADGIAQAGLLAKEKCELMGALVAKAVPLAQANKPAEDAVDPTTGEPAEKPALAMWAERYPG